MRILAVALLLLLAGAAPAAADLRSGEGTTAPGHPGNTLKLTRPDPFVAQTVQKVRFSGHAEWPAPTDAQTIPYELYLYVQDAARSETCADGYGAQLQRAINLPGLNASTSSSGFVMKGDTEIAPDVPAGGLDWSAPSLPFSVRRGVREVLLCGYQRSIMEPVAAFALAVEVVPPACQVGTRSVRRGNRLALDCNVSGTVQVRFTRAGRVRTVPTTLSTRGGDGRVRTGSLPRGRYTVRFVAGAVRLAGTTTVRVR